MFHTIQADAIVNTTSFDLNLTVGAVSKSILKVAGQGIQEECKKCSPKGIQKCQVLATSPHQLKCKKVYHIACSRWDDGKGDCEKVCYPCYCFCLPLRYLP